jgi:hypothetical protein
MVPLPGPDEVKLTRPDAAEVTATARGIASVDFLRQDWFALAPLPLDEVREQFSLRPKVTRGRSHRIGGAPGAGWYQSVPVEAGRAMAADEKREYAWYGASPN